MGSGSQLEAMSEDCFKRLRMPHSSEQTIVSGIGGIIKSTKKVKLVISSNCSNFAIELEVIILPKMLSDQPTQTINIKDVDVPVNSRLADPEFNVKGPIELLLGARIFYQVIGPEQRRIGRGPTFQNSKFGW